MEDYYPNQLLQHVKSVNGNRQDIATESAGPIYCNRPLCVEYLDKRLRGYNKSNILEENLFILMTSLPVVALLRTHAILHLAIVMPVRWLAANTHLLGAHNWSVRSMGRVVDQIEAKATILHEIPSLITNDTFMMSWFREFEEELPPFATYTSFIYNTKQQYSVVRDSTKHLPYKHLRNELFNPQDPSNIESNFFNGGSRNCGC